MRLYSVDPLWLRNLIRFGLPAIVLIFYVTASAHFAYTPDDTYIFMRFAKNLLEGEGIAFNRGEPTYGVTSPLWLMLISAGGWLGIDVYTAAKGLDLVLAGLALLAFYALAIEIIRNHLAVLCATLAFSVNIWFLRWAGTGMETSLSVLLLLLTIGYCLRNEYLMAIVLAALLTFTRPEGLLAAVLVMVDAYMNAREKTRGWRNAASLALVYGALLAPWLIYAYLTFGRVIPNTALAKTGFGFNVDEFAWTFSDVAKTLAVSDGISLAIVVLGVAAVLLRRSVSFVATEGIVGSIPQEASVSNGRWLQHNFVPLMWIVTLPMLYLVTGANVISRYLLMIVPVVIIFAFALTWRLLVMVRKTNWRLAATILLTALIMAQSQWLYHSYVRPSIATFTQGMEECFIPIGKWLNANSPEDAVVFVPDIGAIGYYSNRKICDAAGLVSPEFIPLLRRGYSFDRMIAEGTYRTYCNATYVVRRSYEPGGLTRPDLDSLFTKMVFGLGLSDTRTTYYTLYRVVRIE